MEGKEEKLSVPKFNDTPTKSFHLCKSRLEAVLETKHCLKVVEKSEVRPLHKDLNAVELQESFDKRKKKAAALIIIALGDKPLKVVQENSKSVFDVEKLITRSAGKTTGNKLTLLNEVFSKSFLTEEIMCDYIRDLETAFTKLENAGIPLTDIIQVALLLGSIKNCPDHEATVAAIRTIDGDKTT